MTGYGHRWTGVVLSPVAYHLVTELGGVGWLAAIMVIPAATAPDWLEIQKKGGGTVIKHRTITHWVMLWVALLIYSIIQISPTSINWLSLPSTMEVFSASALFGFASGGLLHLMADLPNKVGIPIFLPHKRFCLKLWKSDSFETPIHVFCVCITLWYFGLHVYLEPLIDLLGIRGYMW